MISQNAQKLLSKIQNRPGQTLVVNGRMNDEALELERAGKIKQTGVSMGGDERYGGTGIEIFYGLTT